MSILALERLRPPCPACAAVQCITVRVPFDAPDEAIPPVDQTCPRCGGRRRVRLYVLEGEA